MQYLKLREEVENPEADKRVKVDWRKVGAFPQGMKLIVDPELKVMFPPDQAGAQLSLNDARAKLIMKKAQPRKARVVDLMAAYNLGLDELLVKSVQAKLITAADMEVMLKKENKK